MVSNCCAANHNSINSIPVFIFNRFFRRIYIAIAEYVEYEYAGYFLPRQLTTNRPSLYISAHVCAREWQGFDTYILQALGYSIIFLVSSSHPRRVLTVTGKFVLFTTASVNFIHQGRSFNTPAPAPLQATFLTGHPS